VRLPISLNPPRILTPPSVRTRQQRLPQDLKSELEYSTFAYVEGGEGPPFFSSKTLCHPGVTGNKGYMITIWGKQDGGCALSTAGEPWHTCVRPESHGTQQRCWRRSRSPQRVCDAMRCRDKPESRTARSVPNRLSGDSGSNRGRRAHSLDQASAGPECCLVQKSIGAVSLA